MKPVCFNIVLLTLMQVPPMGDDAGAVWLPYQGQSHTGNWEDHNVAVAEVYIDIPFNTFVSWVSLMCI